MPACFACSRKILIAWSCMPRGNEIAKRQRRGNRSDGFPALADAQDGDVAIIQDAAEDALIDIDALDLVEGHLEGPPLDEAGLVDNPQIGDVGLGGPAMEPGGEGPVQRGK